MENQQKEKTGKKRGAQNFSPKQRQGERPQRRRARGRQREDSSMIQKVIDIARVTRVMAGGKRMSFRACVVVGDGHGHVGLGVKKGKDVSAAIAKASRYAEKHVIEVLIEHDTIPHEVVKKYNAAVVRLRPAPQGRGILAGAPVRAVLECAGLKNVVTKILGSKNQMNNAAATIEALKLIKESEDRIRQRIQ